MKTEYILRVMTGLVLSEGKEPLSDGHLRKVSLGSIEGEPRKNKLWDAAGFIPYGGLFTFGEV